MRFIIEIILFSIIGLLVSYEGVAQRVINPAFDKKVDQMIGYRVPIISVEKASNSDDFLFLDTREKEEFNVSRIPNARYIGYDDFDISEIENIKKDQPIILYCSIGYRSDRIGGKLKEAGFTKVYNLYGSIFEWVNQKQIIVDQYNQPTNKLHTYNKKWSKWVDNPKIEKVW